jgi:hypothetical protein
MTTQELHDFILADSVAKTFADQGNDTACAIQMMTVLPMLVFRYIPMNIFIVWSASTGVRSKLKTHSEDSSSPVQSIALALLDMMTDIDSPGLDTQDPQIVGAASVVGILDKLVQADVLTESGFGSKANLLSQAPTSTQYISVSDIALAWDQYRPNGRINIS